MVLTDFHIKNYNLKKIGVWGTSMGWGVSREVLVRCDGFPCLCVIAYSTYTQHTILKWTFENSSPLLHVLYFRWIYFWSSPLQLSDLNLVKINPNTHQFFSTFTLKDPSLGTKNCHVMDQAHPSLLIICISYYFLIHIIFEST